MAPNFGDAEGSVDFKLPGRLAPEIDLDDDIRRRIAGQIKAILTGYRGGGGKVEAVVGLSALGGSLKAPLPIFA
jgi:hypothetical protein